MTTTAGRPPSLSPTGLIVLGWAALIVAGIIFLSLAWEVATYAPLVVLDSAIANWLHKHGTAELTAFMIAVTMFHSIAGSTLLAAAFGVVLARLREWYWLLTLTLSMTGGLALNTLLKYVYARVRPYFEDPWVSLTTYSFPSGHTAAAVLFYGVLGAFLVSRFKAVRQRVVCVVGATLAVTLVAFSRMYLGAHYLSDVLAAACSSAVWLVLCLSAVHALVRRDEGRPVKQRWVTWRWIAIGGAVALLAVLALYLPLGEWIGDLEAKLQEMNPLVAIAVFVAVSIVGTLLLVPLSLFEILAGAVFGFLWGTVAALVVSLGASLAAFLISRYFFRGRVLKFMRGRKAFKAFDEAVAKESWKIVALMRLSPIASSGMKSYFFGLTRVDPWTYASASLVGFLPGLLLDVYIGVAGRHAISGGTLEWSLLAAGIVATIAVGMILGRITRKRLAFAF
jgi:undecaprenyl-diphosphatase